LGHPPLDHAIKRQRSRQEYVKIETLIDALHIAPGTTVLDIGSGPGYASFLFAERLQGTGAVFATDIREDFVSYITAEAKRRNIDNLFASVVTDKGFDEFYSRHHYDLVFLSNVYHCLDERVDYFKKLRQFLNPNGRLLLILSNQTPLFSVDDFIKIDDLAKSLSFEGEEGPFRKYLSTGTRQLLENNGDMSALKRSLVEDFNGILTDPVFYRNFYSDSYFKRDLLTPSERDFANWLLMDLDENGILQETSEQIDAKSMRTVIKLNRLFFIKRFGGFLANGGMGAYLPAGDANRHTSKYVMRRELADAGYEIAEEMALSPYYDAVVMVPKKQ
jgi:SAM-dependent methyltransferase